MWRVNIDREGIAREQLPQEPLPPSRLEPWWRVAVVNLAESEYRELGEEELAHLKTAALPAHAAGDIRVRDFQPAARPAAQGAGLPGGAGGAGGQVRHPATGGLRVQQDHGGGRRRRQPAGGPG